MTLYRATTAVIDLLVTVVAALLGLRVILRLFGANADNAMVQAIYVASQPLVAPFVSIFPSLAFDDRFVLEFATLFALVLYAVIAHLVVTAVRAIAYAAFRRRHQTHVTTV